MFEYTDQRVSSQFRQNGNVLFDKLKILPCLFMSEGRGEEIAYVGKVDRLSVVGGEVTFEYIIDERVPPLRNAMLYENRRLLDMPADFEFSRNHWAVKDVDLYRFLFHNAQSVRQCPRVFQISRYEDIQPTLASAMMPFDAGFNKVYTAIQQAAENVGLECRRADDIWEHHAIIQDVVTLIDRSRVVICDCSGRNPNVFYEVGIAHTLGREVILIAQNRDDIPFDLRHIRYIHYHNNTEGCATLKEALQGRMQTILSS